MERGPAVRIHDERVHQVDAFNANEDVRGSLDEPSTSNWCLEHMRLFITAVVAVIISGCAGTGFTDLSTLQKGPNGKTWTQETFESKGSE